MNYIIFDIQITGHHTEYIKYLLEFLQGKKEEDNFYFIVNPNFSNSFQSILELNCSKNINVIKITKWEYEYSSRGTILVRSFKFLKILKKYAKRYDIKHAYLLDMNIFQASLSLIKIKFEISGLIFSQYTRQDKMKNFKEYLRYYKRSLLMKAMVRIKKIKHIYFLNDKKSVLSLNKKYKTNKFKFLPDPIPTLTIEEKLDLRKLYKIPSYNKLFLHYGSLSVRKGTLEILDAIKLIPNQTLKEFTFFFAGTPDTIDLEKKMYNKIDYLKKNSKAQIIWEKKFIERNLTNNLFLQCDAVLMPYKSVEASSGSLSHALSANKKVIGPAGGLLGELISDFGCGETILRITPKKIANKIMNFSFENRGNSNNSIIINKNSPYNFSKIFLSILD